MKNLFNNMDVFSCNKNIFVNKLYFGTNFLIKLYSETHYKIPDFRLYTVGIRLEIICTTVALLWSTGTQDLLTIEHDQSLDLGNIKCSRSRSKTRIFLVEFIEGEYKTFYFPSLDVCKHASTKKDVSRISDMNIGCINGT